MQRELHAIHSMELPAGVAPDWVQLLPAGTFAGRDGRGPYALGDAQAVIAATMAHQAGADLPIDYDHQIYRSEANGRPAVAAGWITELQSRSDGIWGRVEWTVRAAEHLKNREYRYLSPAYVHDRDGNVLRIEGAGLVNNPNLELTALASQLPGGNNVNKLLEALAKAMGLPEDATEETVVTHAKALVAERAQLAELAKVFGAPDGSTPEQLAVHAKTAMTGLAQALGAAEGSTPEQLVAHAKTATGEPDPGKYVSLAVHNVLAGELQGLKRERDQEKAQAAVGRAKAAGKLIPAQEPWALALASKSLEDFCAWEAGAPVVIEPGRVAPVGRPRSGGDDAGKLAARITAYMNQQRKDGREIGYADALAELREGGQQ